MLVFRSYLPSNFKEVNVEVVDCPDLTKPPFHLAAPGIHVTKQIEIFIITEALGLNGSPKLLEIGGTQYLLPLVNKEKVYELKDIAKLIQIEPVFLTGAGAGPYPFIGVNCEVCVI